MKSKKTSSSKKERGISKAVQMRRRADRKGGFASTPDEFDRSEAGNLASLADTWLEWQAQRAFSERTIETYYWFMRVFLRWAHDHDIHSVNEITQSILEKYLWWIYLYRKENGQPLSNVTQRMRLGTLHRFFAWLCRTRRLDVNPSADLELPRKQPRSLPKALSRGEIRSLMLIPDTSDLLGVRDRAILECYYATGMRRRELTQLNVDDLDLQRGIVYIRKGKGGRDRVVPLGFSANRWVSRYLDEVRPQLQDSDLERALFLSGYGQRFSAAYIGNWVRRCMDRAAIDRAGSCHLLRHSCATHMHEIGADILFIQKLLGHARLDTTQIYTEVNIDQLLTVHELTHPSAQKVSK